jgi:hypothetical protein
MATHRAARAGRHIAGRAGSPCRRRQCLLEATRRCTRVSGMREPAHHAQATGGSLSATFPPRKSSMPWLVSARGPTAAAAAHSAERLPPSAPSAVANSSALRATPPSPAAGTPHRATPQAAARPARIASVSTFSTVRGAGWAGRCQRKSEGWCASALSVQMCSPHLLETNTARPRRPQRAQLGRRWPVPGTRGAPGTRRNTLRRRE